MAKHSVMALLDPLDCVGCGLCAEVCPVACLSMKRDCEGFDVPVLDEEKCIDCGLCSRKCPSLSPYDEGKPLLEGRILVARDRARVARSSSGGVFALLAERVLDEGGEVIGAALGGGGRVSHRRITCLEDLSSLQGSKYVQSDITSAFGWCKDAIRERKRVLFSGTPCQVAAIRSCLGETDLLLTVELICHGVPSPGFWEDAVASLVARGKVDDPSQLSFRFTNRYNRTAYVLSEGGRVVVPQHDDLYYTLFMENKSLRESCYRCRYAGRRRQGDLVIGDCATSQNDYLFHPDVPVSSVFPLTPAGAKALEGLLEYCDSKDLDVEREARLNKQLSAPTVRPPERDVVYRDIRTLDAIQLRAKYLPDPGLAARIKELVKRVLPVKARAEIRRILDR